MVAAVTPEQLAWIHPLAAVAVLAALAHLATLGVRARNDRRGRAVWLARHRRLAPWIYGGVVASFAGGLASTWILEPPDELAASGHYTVGIAMLVVLTGSAVSSRWMATPAVRALHPWIGVAGLLLSAAQVFFGLQILP